MPFPSARRVPRCLASLRRTASALLIPLACSALFAQEPETQPDRDHAPFVLHVYANLMQFPTIVLGTNLKPILPVPRQKFAITLDSGPIFHPTQMRFEGNDSIALAVLLDASGAQDKLLSEFADAFSRLAPAFLHPNDRITMYAQDCKVTRSLHDQPPDREPLRAAVEHALAGKDLHSEKPHSTCAGSLRLWDTLALITRDLAEQPGRRVILAVTLGNESRSHTPFPALESYVSDKGAAIFRLRDSALVSENPTPAFYSPGHFPSAHIVSSEDLFAQLCAVSGGMDLFVSRRNIAKQLQDFITLLRGRYILEFPRPDDSTPVHHRIDITIPGSLAFIRSTGGSAPLPDPATLADPNTLHSGPSPAVSGKRNALDPTPRP